MLLDFIMFLSMGATLGVFLFDNHLIPRTYRDFNYLFPLFMNLYLLLNGLYFNVFRVQKKTELPLNFSQPSFVRECNYVCCAYWVWDQRTTYGRLYSSTLHLESEIHLVSYRDLCDLLHSSGLDLIHNKIEEK